MTEPDDTVEALFHHAAELPRGERVAFLDAACRGDPALRAEVDGLLACDSRTLPPGAILDAPLLQRRQASPSLGPPAGPGEVGTLGPYRVLRELGRGGMGAVYEALDTRLGRQAALKVMLPQYADDATARGRFLREARAAARVCHDNVVTVYEAGEHDGVPYIAMQLLRGRPLDEYLKEHRTAPLSMVLRVAREAADGLAAAHEAGLVHRDIKPSNLWLEAPSGRVKVLDFGLARPLDAEAELTKSGVFVGTPAYVSPEQARGEKPGPRADLFSLGAVLYRLCTGRLPFDGPNSAAVLMALAADEPAPVRELSPEVPEPLAALIHQMLARKPDARPASAAEVAERARAIGAGVTAPPRPRFARWAWAAGAAASLLVVGTILYLHTDGGPGPQAPQRTPQKAQAKEDEKARPKAVIRPQAPISEREAAEWVLSLGGAVRVNREARDIVSADALPKEDFELTAVNLSQNRKVTDAGLAHLKDCKNLTRLNLHLTPVRAVGLAHFKNCKNLTDLILTNTELTEAGLAHFKDCKGLTALCLNGSPLDDAGLAHFKDCKKLTCLNLDTTKITDAGLAHFKGCKGLTVLHLGSTRVGDAGLALFKDKKALKRLCVRRTRITPKALAEFHAAVPGCKIEHDHAAIEAE